MSHLPFTVPLTLELMEEEILINEKVDDHEILMGKWKY